jgi:hypothetical protein
VTRLLALVVLALAVAGCGSPPPDLIEVVRTGADRNANVTVLVGDGGTVACNGDEHAITSAQLIRARELVRALADQAELGIQLPPGPNPTLTYRARMERGTVGFTDTSEGIPPTFQQLAQLTKDLAENVCGLAR